jgi:malonyl-CoA decarboxylase
VTGASIIGRLLRSVARRAGPGAKGADRNTRSTRKAVTLCRALLSQRGEASGAALAREVLAAYDTLEGASLEAFFDVLANEFSPDPQEVGRAADAYRHEPSQTNLVRLMQVVEPRRQELFRRLNMASGGTAALVEMRRRILPQLKSRPHWAGIEADLEHLLASWFNRGFLVLARIDWRTSALILEKLIQYEAVHAIQGWKDLRRRLQADRRCFAYFHPSLPDEPIIFIEVALTHGISDKIQPLLDVDSPVTDPARANCAIFYSITNCQEGLRGISFGNFLIKQVAEDLGREFPRLKTFSTLSPIPGFRAWLRDTDTDTDTLGQLAELPGGTALVKQLQALDEPDWHMRPDLTTALEEPLLRLCAYYLLHAKRDGEPLDAVARFHLGNGARMERLNWLADFSKRGMAHSAGIMLNYVYRLDDIEHNHEAYANRHELVSSARFPVLARQCPLAGARGTRS